MTLPPVGYASWEEAAADADENGVLEVMDASGRTFARQIPAEFLPVAREAAKRRAAARLVQLLGQTSGPAVEGEAPAPFTYLRGGPGN